MVSLGDYIYVIGGLFKRSNNPKMIILADCEKFDLKRNKWKAIAKLNQPTYDASVCTFNNK